MGDQIRKNGMGRAWDTYGEEKTREKEKNLVDVGVNGRIILKWLLK